VENHGAPREKAIVFPLNFRSRFLIMIDYAKEKAVKAKVLKKLLIKWLHRQDTASKANILLEKNPDIKIPGVARICKAS
jgi:hypothetical protein